jgi:hypothetical protein
MTGPLKICPLIPWWNALCAIKSTGLLDLGSISLSPSLTDRETKK